MAVIMTNENIFARWAHGFSERWTLKYFDKIYAAEAQAGDENTTATGAFEFKDLGTGHWWSPLQRRLWLWSLRGAFALFRSFWPNPKFGRLVIVTRDDDVQEVLSKPEVFQVPYGPEMKDLGGGTSTFVLGLEGKPQLCQHQLILSLIKPEDTDWLIRRSREIADTLIEASGGRIDVMKDLITRVAAETCVEFFGLDVDDTDAFAEWSMSISALLFADPFGNPVTRKLALAGAARICTVIDAAMSRIGEGHPKRTQGLEKTILERLVVTGTSPDEIRAIMVGMVTGFIPTTTLAAGNLLEELLRTHHGLDGPINAAKRLHNCNQNARAELEKLLFEAARRNPALNPGQWRYAHGEAKIGKGWGSRRVTKGSVLLVSTASAMRDQKHPSYDLMFGHGVHSCLGKDLAMAQITEIFASLLWREELKVKRGLWGFKASISRVGVFPRRLDVDFNSRDSAQKQSMVTVLAPLAADADLKAWSTAVGALGTPAKSCVETAFRATQCIHFASLNAIDLGGPGAPAPYLLLELNGDGDEWTMIDAVDKHVGSKLRSLFGSAVAGAREPDPTKQGVPLGELLRDKKSNVKKLDLKARPWGTTGLCFYGLPGQSVASIERQRELAEFCREAVDYFVSHHAGFGSHAASVLDFVRRLIHGESQLSATDGGPDAAKLEKLLADGPRYRNDLLIPSRQEPKTISWRAPTGRFARLRAVAAWKALWQVYTVLVAVALVVSVLCFQWLGFSLSWSLVTAGQVAIAFVAGCMGTVTLVGLIVGAFLWKLHSAELNDRPEDFNPDLTKVRAIAERENAPGFAQNHFLSVSPLKPGYFRKFTLGIALWGIELLVARCFAPGFILNMGTIHFARWFRPPGSERLVFLSNYDGSWESYLEDFVTKAHAGQSAAWSNAVGFPRTQWLVEKGAEDGDRFKRWVRRQQQPTQFWFNRFPDLTADQMRNNAVICWELARASTDTQARAWLSYFGSMPKTDTEIETEEVQALVFRGFVQLSHMKFAALRLPTERKACADWLRSLVPDDQDIGRKLFVARAPSEVTFGDRPRSGSNEQRATFVAFTAAGLSHVGLSHTMSTFPTAFNLGMATRERILGDFGASAPAGWQWSDDAEKNAVHVALLIYAKSKEECDDLFREHHQRLGDPPIVYQLDTEQLIKGGKTYEHFGFRDGISQPVIRGTQRFAKGAQPRDIMEPGEFLLGYKSNQGYFPPTPVIARESDERNRLGSIPISAETRFESFQDPRPQVRDFGRNGSFLAVRQFKQHVEALDQYVEHCVQALTQVARLPDLIGGPITGEWVRAKMMGRWRDGVPLIDRPIDAPRSERGKETHDDGAGAACELGQSGRQQPHREERMASDTDLDFGVDDPQGLYCPFGAHIRRVNPRGSLAPGDTSQLTITNRHRLLRRGRPYQDDTEKGLLFVGVCADLERQFEFVQQSWLNAAGFAGLTNEPDPIVSVKPAPIPSVNLTSVAANTHPSGPAMPAPAKPGEADSAAAAKYKSATRFTIPTSAGSLSLEGGESFVTVRGGGYFFLPSRSALLFLADRASRHNTIAPPISDSPR